jgi:hypothetical protein
LCTRRRRKQRRHRAGVGMTRVRAAIRDQHRRTLFIRPRAHALERRGEGNRSAYVARGSLLRRHRSHSPNRDSSHARPPSRHEAAKFWGEPPIRRDAHRISEGIHQLRVKN